MPTCSLSPQFRPFELHTYTKMKVEYPPGLHHVHLKMRYSWPCLSIFLFRTASTTVIITVDNMNDNCPSFEDKYTGTVTPQDKYVIKNDGTLNRLVLTTMDPDMVRQAFWPIFLKVNCTARFNNDNDDDEKIDKNKIACWDIYFSTRDIKQYM